MTTTTVKKEKQAIDKFQLVTDKLSLLLEEGVKPWEKPWHSNGLAFSNLVTKHRYQGINPTLCSLDCLLNNYTSPYFVGFHQARKLGWGIKKGSQATWLVWGGSFSKEVINRETGEAEKKWFNAFKWLNVFNLDCVTDDKSDKKLIEFIPKEETYINPYEKIEDLEVFIQKQEVSIKKSVGDKACYIPSQDVILMPPYERFKSANSYYSTILHELTHSTGHYTRLDRDIANLKNSSKYAYEELIAEIGSAMTGYHFNIVNELDNHASYIASWLTALKNDKKYFFKAIKEAKKASNYLLEKGGITPSYSEE